MSTQEDRRWDVERDSRVACGVLGCAASEARCPGHTHTELIQDAIEKATGRNGKETMDALEEFGVVLTWEGA